MRVIHHGRSGADALTPVLEFRQVVKCFGSVTAVDGVSFSVQSGELFTLLGPSGCGKTTTLRLVAGLEEPDSGEILLNGEPVAAPKRGIFVAPDKRQMGMVFQSYAIWPHLTVFENVAFPLRARREAAAAIKKRVLQALETVGLLGFEARGATELSGGQQQRVALARALVYTPTILLLDEPLSNLDAKLREHMRLEIRALQKTLNLTVLYVTHDQAEAMTLSDRMAVAHHGRFEQVGRPIEVYERPATPFVADFLGRMVIFEGIITNNHAGQWIELANGDGRLSFNQNTNGSFAGGETVRILTRPEDIEILPQGELLRNQLRATVNAVAYLGDHFEYHVQAGESTFVLSATKKQRYSIGSELRLGFDPETLDVRRR
jgi:ABC-type Fe3+/spermidine/putrescine transport system ATPase subunit